MGTPYLSEIKLVSFNFPPKGWAFCNGQTLPINQNQALFALLGTTYGGNGTTTFQLPNLQGATPMHMGSDPFGNSYVEGQTGGQIDVTLTGPEIPAHSHRAQGSSTVASQGAAAGNVWGDSASDPYGASPNTILNPRSVEQVGGGQPHDNMPPYLVLNYIIALQGIFPSRN